VFPNAVVRAGKADADHWLSQANLDKAPADKKGTFQGAMASLDPYVQAGKFKAFEKDGELVAGHHGARGHGHTPGHTTYVVESRGQKLVLIGDLIHVAAVQMDNPQVTIGFDSDEKAAAARARSSSTRRRRKANWSAARTCNSRAWAPAYRRARAIAGCR
jgi:glyoxylase-like metal-dependent hydrolase (beta-lactamase superfamily II)